MNANDLLLWFSARGTGSWSRYRTAVDELQAAYDESVASEDLDEDVPYSGDYPIHLRLKSNLELLGHVEFFRKDFPHGWRIVPPTLACTGTGTRVAGILCGARTDELLSRIEQVAAHCQIEKSDQSECPDRIRLFADSSDELREVAREAGLHFQPAAPRSILAALPPIDSRQFQTYAELPFGPDWEVSRFSTTSLGWNQSSPEAARSASFGFFRFNPSYPPAYFLRLRADTFKVPVQVGKYVALKKSRRRILSYDATSHVLSVPISCRPPLLIDRALTLCTGLVPRIVDGRFEYHSVSKAIARTASNLLKQ